MHLEASKFSGCKAPVGQALMHLQQFLHADGIGVSGASFSVVTISPSRSCEPRSGFMSI